MFHCPPKVSAGSLDCSGHFTLFVLCKVSHRYKVHILLQESPPPQGWIDFPLETDPSRLCRMLCAETKSKGGCPFISARIVGQSSLFDHVISAPPWSFTIISIFINHHTRISLPRLTPACDKGVGDFFLNGHVLPIGFVYRHDHRHITPPCSHSGSQCLEHIIFRYLYPRIIRVILQYYPLHISPLPPPHPDCKKGFRSLARQASLLSLPDKLRCVGFYSSTHYCDTNRCRTPRNVLPYCSA